MLKKPININKVIKTLDYILACFKNNIIFLNLLQFNCYTKTYKIITINYCYKL